MDFSERMRGLENARNSDDDELDQARVRLRQQAAEFITFVADAVEWARDRGAEPRGITATPESRGYVADWDAREVVVGGDGSLSFTFFGGTLYVARPTKLERNPLFRRSISEYGYRLMGELTPDHQIFTSAKGAHGPQGFRITDSYRSAVTNACIDEHEPSVIEIETYMERMTRRLSRELL
ncbi:hypothetical protein [Leucobacter ruminantium]|uniref:Uncharacterized protein n=1 Tax=Leucobacter ruminantium TaxID=1289170 RepID=A0A939M090_9MICO|nr:hypothetical protein [Leucobacter ruminantium]MBO1806343.1 hypothetical protein [Leucobacter ruminantium]